MKNRNSSPARSILDTAAQTASSSQPPAATGAQNSALSPTSVLSVPFVPSVQSPSSSEISSLKSPSDPDSVPSPSTVPLSPASAPSAQNSALFPSDLAAARDLIASIPATKAMHKLQSLLDNHEVGFLNPDQVAQFSTLLTVYAKLQNSAAIEHIMEALAQVGAGYKREPLTRELTKVLSIQDRALARAQREKAAKERDQRRIEREAKQQQAQAAKQVREERLFNQREDHLARKEKIASVNYETQLLRQNNSQHQSSDKSPHRQHTSAISQGATQPTVAPLLQAKGLEML